MREMAAAYLPVSEAARRANVTSKTIRNWLVRDHELGVRVGGRWRVNPRRLGQLLAGAPLARTATTAA